MTTRNHAVTQDEINRALWAACDALRGPVDPAEYKDFVLPMLFFKYLSDLWRDAKDQLEAEYEGDPNAERLVARKLGRLPFQVPEGQSFYDVAAGAEHDKDLGQTLNKATAALEEANGSKLDNIFQNVDFNSEAKLGEPKEKVQRLRDLIRAFNRPILDFRPSVLPKQDLVGNGYMYLVERFAEGAGKKGGEFFTPPEVSKLLAKLLDAQPGDRIYDPTMGSGSLAIAVADHVRDAHQSNDFALYGQEVNSRTWALAEMNAVLHGFPAAHFKRGDTLSSPKHTEGNALMRFDVVAANPPFSLKDWGHKHFDTDGDAYERFGYGLPPRTRGDYAFILHMIASAAEDGGKVGVVVANGVLFRGGAEGRIRQRLIDEGLLEAVIGLPEKLFYGTGIPAAILLFRRGRAAEEVLFIDASEGYVSGTRQNKLGDDHIARIVDAVQAFRDDPQAFEDIDKFAHRAPLAEIQENDYNLNIPRYVDTYEPEDAIDIEATQRRIYGIERELEQIRGEMREALKALDLYVPEEAQPAGASGEAEGAR